MTKVAIVPVPSQHGGFAYRAVAGDKQSEGSTAGAALDALSAPLSAAETSTLVVIQSGRPDPFFDAAQQQRLGTLMTQWHAARALGHDLPGPEQSELKALIDAEVRAAAARADEAANTAERAMRDQPSCQDPCSKAESVWENS